MNFSFLNLNFGKRLKSLYDFKSIDISARGWSQKVAKELFCEKIISIDEFTESKDEYGKDNTLTKKTSFVADQLRKHLNLKNAPETIWIHRYCEYFGCSADYLLGLSSSFNPDFSTIHDLTGLSEKAIDNLLRYKGSEISVLNTLLSCDLFSQVLQHYGRFLTSEYCIPVHPDGNQWKVSDYDNFDGFDDYGGFLYLAKSINNPSDNIPMPFDSTFVEDHEMNQIREFLKDIKKIATGQNKLINPQT